MVRRRLVADGEAVRFSMLYTPEERSMLEALARGEDRSAANWVRQAIRRAYEEKFGGKPPKKPKR